MPEGDTIHHAARRVGAAPVEVPPLHSHLRMGGKWGVYRRGAHRAWLVIRTAEHEVVQFAGPVLELMTDARTTYWCPECQR